MIISSGMSLHTNFGIFRRLMLFLRTYLILLPSLIFSLGAFSQPTNHSVRQYTMKDGLSQMKTTSIIQDSLGYFWIGTRSGLNRFDGANIISYGLKDGLPHERIHNIVLDSLGHPIFLTMKGVAYFDGKTFSSFQYDFLAPEYRFFIDREQRLWIHSPGELLSFFDGTYTSHPHQPLYNIISDVANGDIYFCRSDGLYTYRGNHFERAFEGRFTDLRAQNAMTANGDFIFRNYSPHINQTFGYIRNGQVRFFGNLADWTIENPDIPILFIAESAYIIKHGEEEIKDAESPFIRIVKFIDDQFGNYWIAAENGFIQIQNSPFTHYPFNIIPYIWTMSQDDEGRMWAASFGYGLFRQNDEDVFERYRDADRLVGNIHYLAASCRGKDGESYIGNTSGLLQIKDGKLKNTPSSQPIYAVVYNHKTDQILTAGTKGVFQFGEDLQLETSFDIEKGLHFNEYIQNLSIDSSGGYWAGSNTGLSKINSSLTACTNYTKQAGSLPSEGVYSSFIDQDGNVWLGGDESLMLYHKENDSIGVVESALMKSIVKSICTLDSDHLLIGAKDGLYVFNRKKYLSDGTVEISFYNETNGYLGQEPGFTGINADNKGNIWICSATSVDKLDPSRLRLNTSNVKVNITDLNNTYIPFSGIRGSVSIDRGVADVLIGFDAIGIIRPPTIKYQHRVDEGPWSEWNTNKSVWLTDLDHGKHKFEVRAGPTDLLPSDSYIDSIEFEISLPFFKRGVFPWIAYSTISLLFFTALILYFRQRWENKKFVSQLTASKYLRSRLLLSELNPHFIFNVLASIQHKVLLGDRDDAASYVVKLSKMIRNFLSASHQSHQSIDNYRENDIALSKEIELLTSYLDFEMAKSDNFFEVSIELSPEIVPSQVYIPPMLIQPFVENSIKHGLLLSDKKGMLKLKIDYLEGDLCIVVEDNGVGRKKASEIKKDRTGHVSLGTLIIDQRIALLNELGYKIQIDTEDVMPQGTKVTITLKD